MKTSSKKKGKYTPLSYFIENDLIIYSSLNQIKKLIAFGILQIQEISKPIQILNNFLNKSCLESYTIQIGINTTITYIILKFISVEKKELIQDLFKLCELLNNTEIQYSLLKENLLEMGFLTILGNGSSSELNEMNYRITKKGLSVTINDLLLNYGFYNIKLDLITDDIYFFQHLIKFLEEREIKGYLFIYNTNNGIGELKRSAYLVKIQKNEDNMIDFLKISNKFFKKEILDKQKPRNDFIWQYLWRIPITNDLSKIENLYIMDSKEVPTTRNEIINLLEKSLKENDIKYRIVNDFQILINQNRLFSVFSRMNLEKLSEIIKEHINQYHIYVVIINKNDYLKLVGYENITEINNLNILCIEEFLDLDYDLFK